MKKTLTVACTVAALVAPTAASAGSQQSTARHDAIKACKQLRKAAGKKNFARLYGKNAYGKCVSKKTHEIKVESQQSQQGAATQASQQCKAERQQDPAAFQQKYGTNKNGKNAYGKCVSQHSEQNQQQEQEQSQQEDQNEVSAAKTCRTEQQQDPAAFDQKYGTNANHRNAFGKCVSRTSSQEGQSQS